METQKTKEEIDDLKVQWVRGSEWDIEDTPGFEAHREELYEWRVRFEQNQKAAQEIKNVRFDLNSLNKALELRLGEKIYIRNSVYTRVVGGFLCYIIDGFGDGQYVQCGHTFIEISEIYRAILEIEKILREIYD